MPVSRQVVNEKSMQLRAGGGGLLRKSSIVAAMTMLSRVLGFLRDIVLASLFGAGGALDAFLIAFKIPNFFRRLFGEGAFSQAFVPVLSQYKEQADHEQVHLFISRIFSNLALSLFILVALAEAVAPGVIMVFAPGFIRDPERFRWAVHMLRVTFPYIMLISLTAMSGAVLNTHQRFAVPAFAPVLLNVALIMAAVLWAPHWQHPIFALSWGVILGGVLQLVLQLPVLRKLKLLPRFAVHWRDPQVKRVLRLMLPALFGVSVAQISLMIDNGFASFLPAGSISWLYYSDRLTYLPLGVIGVALATVVLPTLSRQFHVSRDEYARTLSWALQTVLFVGTPAALSLMILADPVLSTLFLHGHFGRHDVLMTGYALVAFAMGLPAFMLIKILASAFYSMQNIRTPVKVAAVALLVNVVGNVVFVRFYQHAGLALATSIAAYVNALSLLWLLWKGGVLVFSRKWGLFLGRLCLANMVMGVLLFYFAGSTLFWLNASLLVKAWHLSVLILMGLGSYVFVMWLLGWRWSHLRKSI